MNQIGRHTGKRKQWNRAVEALLLTTTSRDAAKAAGISETTLYRYLNDGSFRAMYNEAKRRMLDGTINKLRLASSGAVDVLEAIAHDPASPQSARVAAAKTLLEMAVRCGAIEEIEQRLLELEASNAKVIEGCEVNKMALLRRIAKLEKATGVDVKLTMPDGTVRMMRQQTLFDTFANSVLGTTTPETAIMLASIADNSGTKLAELLKAVCG